MKNDTKTVRALLAAGADINHVYKRFDYTVLIKAAQHGHTEMVRALLAARVNYAPSGDNALEASRTGYKEVIKVIKEEIEEQKHINKEKEMDYFFGRKLLFSQKDEASKNLFQGLLLGLLLNTKTNRLA